MTPRPKGDYLRELRHLIEQTDIQRTTGGQTLVQALAHAESGQYEEALAEAVSLAPSESLCDLALIFAAVLNNRFGRETIVGEQARAALSHPETSYEILCLAADLLRDMGDLEGSIAACDRALDAAPHASHALLRRGRAQSLRGDITAAIHDFHRATLLQPNLLEAHIALGDEYRGANMSEAAIASYRRALEIAPDNRDALTGLDLSLAAILPQWHAAMLNDRLRGNAFEAAIGRAVHSGSHVLDIGTGTGLLAMMAVRAGAARVTACEAIGPLAEAAREIVHRNGMSDRIEIIHARSTDLIVGTDMATKADLLIAEIVDAGLLSEGIITSFADARKRLLKPDAAIIPRGATVYGAPIECAEVAATRTVSTAANFDVTPFNRLIPDIYVQTDLSRYDWRPLCAPIELFQFDFTKDEEMTAEKEARFIPNSDSTAHALAFWFTLQLDPEVTISTSPMDPPTHWQQAVYAVTPARELKQNESARLRARHDGNSIHLSLA
jgi:predicted RNA methylase